MIFFLVNDLVLRIFPFFSHIFRMFTMLNVVYDHFLTRKTQCFTLFMLSRTSDNTTSQNIGWTNAWAVPPTSNFWGRPPVPLGLRPCMYCTEYINSVTCVYRYNIGLQVQTNNTLY